MTTFTGDNIARGWLSTAIASSTDTARPALHRTVAIEAFPTGIRLVATDSYVLLRSWVPNVSHPVAGEPPLDEAPYARAIATDPHGRARSFLAHVLKLSRIAEKADETPPEVRLNLGIVDEVPDTLQPAFAGMEARYVVLELLTDTPERIKLVTYDGPFPEWRSLGFTPEPTSTIALNPEIVGRLSKLSKYLPGTVLGFEWGGTLGVARITSRVASGDLASSWGYPDVSGLVMPCRWDFDTNSPRDDPRDDVDQADDVELPDPTDAGEGPDVAGAGGPIFDAAVRFLSGPPARLTTSAGALQRALRIGFARSAALIDELERRGIIEPPTDGTGIRDVRPGLVDA